jgi:hypothetical protein
MQKIAGEASRFFGEKQHENQLVLPPYSKKMGFARFFCLYEI